ncbi:MAG: hypothetical protein LQ351_005883 [Letrouitia transgressa]|nr:MAG: hypothetical protein LQ351_005883 [Letrouitia transgressa]
MADPPSPTRQRGSSGSSGRLRSASLKLLESNPPPGFLHATGEALAKAPLPAEIRRGEYSHSGWDGELQRRNSIVSEESSRRISRQNSAQTPVSLTKSPTNQLDTHHESHEEDQEEKAFGKQKEKVDEDEDISQFIGRGQMADQSYEFKPRPKRPFPVAINKGTEKDVDGPEEFLGRGEMSDQSYVPKSQSTTPRVQTSDSLDDELDLSDDELAPRTKRKGLPNKFADPSDPPPPPTKLNLITTEQARPSSSSSKTPRLPHQGPDADGVYPNGYKFPPKHSWGEATLIGLKGLWRFTLTPVGFLIVLYGLNVVAWGGMLFLLLVGGGKQFMCYPPGSHGEKDCNNINAPRRIWIEIDSQILNALFCVTGFGLAPWRFRDLYFLLRWRVGRKYDGLRRLAGVHRSWFRLAGSDGLPVDGTAQKREYETSNPEHPAIPIPAKKAPDQPLTGIRAPPTKLWKLDYVIWAYMLNTFLQAVLSGFMWGLNRYDRPSWSTGTFVALACIAAALGGLMVFQEGKRVKAVEGIPVKQAEVLKDIEKDVKSEKGEGAAKAKLAVKYAV